MMWELGKPSMRDRVLALSALFIALLLFVFGLVAPYLALLENSYEQLAQSQQQRALFTRLRSLVQISGSSLPSY